MKKIKGRKNRILQSRIFKGIIGIMFIILMVFRVHSVDAGMNDSVIEKNRIPDIYAYVILDGQEHWYYLNMYTMNGRVAYCLDLGVGIYTDIYHSTSDFGVSNFSDEQIEFLRAVSYYGYRYPGHDPQEYYMAAQEIIWEYLKGVDVLWTNTLGYNDMIFDIEFYKEEILGLVETYQRNIIFDWNDSNIVSIGDKLVIRDINRVVSSYEIYDSGHSNVSILYDDLIIDIGGSYVGRETIVLKKKDVYDYPNMFYYYDNSQRLISIGNYPEKLKQISFYIKGATVNFQIIDRDTKLSYPQGQALLSGAKYELYKADGTFVDEFVTDENGQALISNLVYGSYYVKQIEASLGYLINDEVVWFELNTNSYNLRLEEQVISNQFEIQKLYGKNSSGIVEAEENVRFLIYDVSGNVYKSVLTNNSGLASFLLPYGDYVVHQDNTSFGYAKVEDFEIKVDVYREDKIRYSLMDSLIQCSLKVVSKDNNSKEVIRQVGFKYKIYDVNEEEYLNFHGNEVFESGNDGILYVPVLLKYGEYRLEQIEVVNCYYDSKQKLNFSINEKSNFEIIDGNLLTTVDVFYEMIMGELEVITTKEEFFTYENGYEYQKDVRADVLVDLIADDEIKVNGNLMYQKGDIVKELVTDSNGEFLIKDLYLGSYCVKERESQLEECFTFELIDNTKRRIKKKVELEFLLEKANILLNNISEDGFVIEGSVFEVYDEKDELIYTGMTDVDGIFKITNLIDGKYCFKQIKVGSLDYELNTEKKCVELVVKNGDEKIEFINIKHPKKLISVPNTFREKGDLKKLILLVIMVIGGFIYWKKKSKSNFC